MKLVALSGWGQPHDALAGAFPEAAHFNYARYDSVEAALAALAQEARQADMLIGWSLGGQLAARAIGEGLIAPRRLVLIAAPFQFVQSGAASLGMKRDTFGKFFDNYMRNPARTLHKAWELVHLNDPHARQIGEVLGQFSKQAVMTHDWLKWLSLIEGYSCEQMDFSRFPPTLIVQGGRDLVVEPAQAEAFAKRIPRVRLELWPDCGHAPHWHDTATLQKLVWEHGGI